MQSDYARGRGKPAGPTRPPGMPSTWTRSTAVPGLPVVHIIRDGRDVVASHRDRWGSLSALKAVRKWPWYVRAARAAGARLSAEGRYYEVRYEDLVTDPETTLHKLLDFLGEPWDDAVLQHDRVPHDVQPRYLAFSSSRRAASGEHVAIYRSRIGSGRRELGPLLSLTRPPGRRADPA
jgi:hypothetical protein